MSPQLHDLARRLADNAEGVCRHYLSNGRLVGGYWIVGDAFAAIGKAGILNPMMAGWAPNLLATGTACYLILTART